MTLFLVAVLAALLISALCSLMEATVLSLTPSQVAHLGSRQPGAAAIWQRFKLNIEKPIAVILVLNTAAHTIGATIAGAQFTAVYGEQWLVAFSLVFTYLMLQFTEILPKSLGVRYNAAIAPALARPLDLLIRLLSPILYLVHLVNRPFERPAADPRSTALGEITALAASAMLSRAIDPQQERLIRVASQLPLIRIREVMTPRTEVVFLNLDQSFEDAIRIVRASKFTRLPLCDGDLDHVVGVVHAKDLLDHLADRVIPAAGDAAAPPAPPTAPLTLRELAREALFLPEQTSLLNALRSFQDSRLHLAVVVDEYGATEGIVSLEDAVEEILGEIEDEFDEPEAPPISTLADGLRVSGRTRLRELAELIDLPDLGAAHVDTLGGYITQKLGRWPRPGDTIPIGRYTAHVAAVTRRRITDVHLKPTPDPEARTEPAI